MPDGITRHSFASRACENCRIRKIRCDKKDPCASCQTSGIVCNASIRRAGTHTPREVTPSQYDSQLELIKQRLHVVEGNVTRILEGSISVQPQRGYERSGGHTQIAADSSVTAFEGASSFANHIVQASQAADHTAASIGRPSPQLSSMLSSLKDNVRLHGSASQQHESRLAMHKCEDCFTVEELPPIALVTALVKRMKDKPPVSLVALAWRDLSQIQRLCQGIYLPVEPLPEGSVTLMYGILSHLIRDSRASNDEDLMQFDLATNADMCERNFRKRLEAYKTLTVPTMENVQSLLLGAIKAQEEFKPSLGWTLTSSAARLCYILGYHREASLRGDVSEVAEAKRHVFWMLYTIDKNLSLNLGRPSSFLDYDIDARIFSPSVNLSQKPWDFFNIAGVEFARVQGQIYDRLYSASARFATLDERLKVIDDLSARLANAHSEIIKIDVADAYHSDHLQIMVKGITFIFNSMLTVIYRAQSPHGHPSEITTRCSDAARATLESNLHCFAALKDSDKARKSEFVNWVLLYPPFTPFLVIFTHAIMTSDCNELALLEETVRVLDLVKDISRGAYRLHNVCRSFSDTAKILINSRRTLNGLHQNDDGTLLFSSFDNGLETIMSDQDLSWPEECYNVDDMSAIFTNWIGDNQPVGNMASLPPLVDGFDENDSFL